MMYTGFICGGFTTTAEPASLETIDARWHRVEKSVSERAAGHRMYVPAFYDFCYHTGSDRNTGLRRYRFDANADIMMPVSGTDRTLPVHIGDVEFSFAPFSVAIFSARFDIDTDNVDDLITVVNKLRYVSLFASDRTLDEFREIAITPILKVYGECGVYKNSSFNPEDPNSCRFLVENNNKFRIFQIVSVNDATWDSKDIDNILFELGSMVRIGINNPNDLFSPSKDYFQRTMEAGRIDIFNNWKGLALFDTFTMMGHNVPKEVREYWIEVIFKMLYTSQMFVKMYLTRLNKNFRMYLGDNNQKLNRNVANKLQNRYDEFECKCWFDNVAYSLLPCEIHTIIGRTMEISVEKERLYEKIMRQNLKREKMSDQRMNKLLFFMTMLAMSSAIWDACCLVEGMYPFDPHESQIFIRVITYVVLFVILIVLLTSNRRRE